MTKAFRSECAEDPSAIPRDLRCPECAAMLRYRYTVTSGIPTNREQWAHLVCPQRCGSYDYRLRTGRLRRLTV